MRNPKAIMYCPEAGGLRLYAFEILSMFPRDAPVLFASTGPDVTKEWSRPLGERTEWLPIGSPIKRRDSYRSVLHWALSRVTMYAKREIDLIKAILKLQGSVPALHIQEGSLWLYLLLAVLKPMLGCRQILTVHNVRQHDSQFAWVNAILDRVYPVIWRNFDVLITHGRRSSARLAERADMGHRRLVVIPHPIPRLKAPAGARSVEERRALRSVLFFGSLRRNKGIDVLIPAIAGLTDYKIVIAGKADDPVLAEEVQFMLAKLPSYRWTWVNRFIPDDEVVGYFRDSSLVVLPYRDFEAQSGVLNLAFGTSTPCIVSNEGDMAEFVRHIGSGVVVDQPTVDGLKGAIVDVHSRETYHALTRACTEFDFDLFNRHISTRTSDLYVSESRKMI